MQTVDTITKDTNVTKKVEPPKPHPNHKQTAASLDRRHRHKRELHGKRLNKMRINEGLEETATGAGGLDTKNNNAGSRKNYDEWKEKGKEETTNTPLTNTKPRFG